MNAKPARLENLHTDKGKVPVYATGIVAQPWDDYTAADHDVWRQLYERQRQLLVGRASDEFLQAQGMMGMSPDRIPRFDELNRVLEAATGWTIVGVEGLLPELDFFEHLANRRFPVSWWIRRPDQWLRGISQGLTRRMASARRRWPTSPACTGTRSSSA